MLLVAELAMSIYPQITLLLLFQEHHYQIIECIYLHLNLLSWKGQEEYFQMAELVDTQDLKSCGQ